MRFGMAMSGVTLMDLAYNGTPELLLGKIQGMTAAGFFGRAQGLVNLFERLVIDGMAATLLAVFRKQLHEGSDVSRTFLNIVALVSAVGWAALAYVALFAHPVINLLYGPQWGGSVDISRLLCAATSVLLPSLMCPALLVAAGHVRKTFALNLAATLMQAAYCVVGAYYGLVELGWTMLVVAFFVTTIRVRAVQSVIKFSWGAFFLTLGKSLLVLLVACLVPVTASIYAVEKPMPAIALLIISGFGMAGGFLIAAKLTSHPVWEELSRYAATLHPRPIKNNAHTQIK
jgi:O-antigen/teichoic acid export membrane protein